jgi:diacylglycerol kinase family enzyme
MVGDLKHRITVRLTDAHAAHLEDLAGASGLTRNKVLRYWQLPEFTIEAEREVHFNLDGEPTTEHKLHFSVLPKHLKVAF